MEVSYATLLVRWRDEIIDEASPKDVDDEVYNKEENYNSQPAGSYGETANML